MHSLAGGTGSGLGCRLTEKIRERHPALFICSVVISAFQSGEIPLQHLNATLCLAHLQGASDAIILFSNAEVMELLDPKCRRAIRMADINEYICTCLLATFQWGQVEGALCNLVATLAPDPRIKFLTMYKYPPNFSDLAPEVCVHEMW